MNSKARMPPCVVVKRNAERVVCLWSGDRSRSDLAQPEPELYPAFAWTLGSDATRAVAAQAKDSSTTVYGATFGSVEATGRRWVPAVLIVAGNSSHPPGSSLAEAWDPSRILSIKPENRWCRPEGPQPTGYGL